MLTTQPNQLVFKEFETEVKTPILTPAFPSSEQSKPQTHPDQESDALKAIPTLIPTVTTTSVMPTYPIPTGYNVYELTKINPKPKCQRYYQVAYQPTLWTNHCLHRSWGRIGKKLHTKEQTFECEEEALKWLNRLLKRKLKRGYLLNQSTPVADSSNSSTGTETLTP